MSNQWLMRNQPSKDDLLARHESLAMDDCFVRGQSTPLERRGQNRFNYSTQIDLIDSSSLNLHHKYFQLYEKYTVDANGNSQSSPLHSYHDKKSQQDLLRQVHSLKKELQKAQLIIKRLNCELEEVTRAFKLQIHENEYGINELREQIAVVLERNNTFEKQNRSLREIIRDIKCQLHFPSQTRSLTKPLSHPETKLESNSSRQKDRCRESEGERKLVDGVKEMYLKITGVEASGLKEVWRWLKHTGVMLHRLRKWRNRNREKLRTATPEEIVILIEEAMVIID